MIDLGQDHPKYVSSSILSKKIKQYHDDCVELLPFLQSKTNFKVVSTDQSIDKSMDQVYREIEPLVIHVRPGANSNELKHEIIKNLSKDHGFINLDVNQCTRGEVERGTNIGKEFQKYVE